MGLFTPRKQNSTYAHRDNGRIESGSKFIAARRLAACGLRFSSADIAYQIWLRIKVSYLALSVSLPGLRSRDRGPAESVGLFASYPGLPLCEGTEVDKLIGHVWRSK